MKEMIINWLCRPENIILLVIGLIQLYKLIKPSLPAGWVTNIDKASGFLSWAVPAVYNVIEGLEERGLIDKKSKFSAFVDLLFEAAKKQNLTLSMADMAKAKLMAEGLAQASKAPRTLPTDGPPITGDSVAQ